MKRLWAIFTLAVLLTGCHLEDFPFGGGKDAQGLTVKIKTADATEVDFSSARLEASFSVENADSEGGLAYFYYAAFPEDAQEVKPDSLASIGKRLKAGSVAVTDSTFRTAATELEPLTLYRFVPSILIDGEEFYGDVKSFTTSSLPGEMSVTGKADEITEISARLSAFAFPTSGLRDYTMGVLCSTEQEPDFNNGLRLTATEMNVKNKYTVMAEQLIPDTTYYFRSFLQYGTENRFGEIQRFRTLKLNAQVNTAASSDIGMYSAVLHGSLEVKSQADLPKEVWFLYGDGKVDDLATLKAKGRRLPAKLGADGQFSGTLTMLQNACDYHFVACAKVYDRELYGDVQSFTTSDVSASIVTGSASDIGMFSATLSATLTIDNQEELPYSVFFLYIENGQEEGERVTATEAEDGSYTAQLTDLKFNTEYQFVAGAKVKDREVYGKVAKFKTADLKLKITTGAATDLDHYSAVANATLQTDNPETVSMEVYFMVGDIMDKDTLLLKGTRYAATRTNDKYWALVDKLGNKYLEIDKEYYYVACADVAGVQFAGNIVSFTTKNYPYLPAGDAVDLGFSVKWCSKNLGATAPEDFGVYIPWGETTPRKFTSWADYKWATRPDNSLKISKYCRPGDTAKWYQNPGAPDGKLILDHSDDIVRAQLGDDWRMPTALDFLQLMSNCNATYVTLNGVPGIRFTSKLNGQSIFLPIAGAYSEGAKTLADGGWYWTSELSDADSFNAVCLYISPGGVAGTEKPRCMALSIRPVKD